MPIYEVYYTATVNHECVREVEADSEEDAIEQVKLDGFDECDSESYEELEINVDSVEEVN